MPATAKTYGLRVDEYIDERYDAEKATDAAIQYLKKAYDKF
jgi:soluble lytic murein transglycosylase-like protein